MTSLTRSPADGDLLLYCNGEMRRRRGDQRGERKEEEEKEEDKEEEEGGGYWNWDTLIRQRAGSRQRAAALLL